MWSFGWNCASRVRESAFQLLLQIHKGHESRFATTIIHFHKRQRAVLPYAAVAIRNHSCLPSRGAMAAEGISMPASERP